MRNLKRALSLALASVMLLGMMVVGSSAAFSDADEIVNKEAVEITAGLGLFAGSDGKFNPKDTVTRAQMAAVIAKMFYGSDLNADTYKGGNKFSDTVSFEGGWAEGYVNLGVEKGWFKGYGDGTFGPGNAVTTAEAVTMLINLLGVDAGEGTWPMTVMAAAEDIELFDMEGGCELKPAPATNVALTRDQLSVMVWNALNYSAEEIKGYSFGDVKIKFDSWADAAAYAEKWATTNGTTWDADDIKPIKNDTLAKTVFEMANPITRYIVANQATGEKFTLLSDGTKLNIETGLDMLGHYVTAYYAEQYKNENNPGTAYALVEAAEYVTVAEDIEAGDKKEFVATFGATKFEIKSKWAMSETAYTASDCADWEHHDDVGHTCDFTYPTFKFNENYETTAGTYLFDIEDGKLIAYLAPIAYEMGKVTRINTTPGKESIKIGTQTPIDNTADDDFVVEYAGIAKDDVVIMKDYRGMTYLEKIEPISGKITKIGKVDGADATYIDGKAYINETVTVYGMSDLKTSSYEASNIKTYDAYVYGDKLLGVIETAGAAALSDAIFVINKYEVKQPTNYGTLAHWYAQGINAAGEEVSILVGVEGATSSSSAGADKSYYTDLTLNTFYTFENEREDAKKAQQDVMKPKKADVESDFATDIANDTNAIEFFGAEATVADSKLEKDTKSIEVAGKPVYLTADTKFVVVEKVTETVGTELEIATYTGNITKTLESGDKAFVAATADVDDNYLAQIVVIVAGEMGLAAEDYLYVLDKDDCSAVDGGLEYVVYSSAANDFVTIVSKGSTKVDAGFYGNYKVDEDGLYIMGSKTDSDDYVEFEAEVQGIMNTSIKFDSTKLYDAKDAVVVDIRTEEVLKNTNVEFDSIEDIFALKRDGYKVYFNALVDVEDEDAKAITHIFVYSVKVENNAGGYDEA